jgi:hypothetical protein
MAARTIKNLIPLAGQQIAVYASPSISAAFKHVSDDMNMFKGVKLAQLLEAVYEQGKKDGARKAFEAIEGKFAEAAKAVPHKNPGKPKKKP